MIRNAQMPGRMRFALAIVVTLFTAPASADTFQQWLQVTWPEAEKLGVTHTTFVNATRGLAPDLTLPDLDISGRKEAPPQQAEFVQTPGQYLREPTFAGLAAQGKKFAAQYKDTLARIEREFGVPGTMVLAIWARETDYGRQKDSLDAMRVLATQAFTGKRKDFFRNEFLHALKMLQDGVPRENLRSSWGGAMGLTQFLPSEYYKYAVDFDGDGKADIWHSVPDALASAAKQLAGKGWQRTRPGRSRCACRPRVDCTKAEPGVMAPVADWLKRGYVPAYGRKLTSVELSSRRLAAAAGRHLWARLSHAEELLRAQGIQLLRPLRALRRPPRAISSPAAGRSSIRGARGRSSRARTSRRCSAGSPRSASTATRSTARPACSRAPRSAPIRRRAGIKVDCWPTGAVLEHMRR